MQKDVWTRGDVDDVSVSRSRCADARQSPGRVDDTRWVVIRALQDDNQLVNEACEQFI